ncbi:MAG: nuclear transport factor 2 family protein [Rhodospirillaceae bacterium]|nr:nuclear transport factor 2 family protein [Rhodospirillaceae bacterium]
MGVERRLTRSAMPADSREALRRLVHESGRFLDDRRYDDFVALFVDDGNYRVEVDAPELSEKMVWMALTRDELAERFESAPMHEWRFFQQTRLVAVDTVDVDGDDARSVATVSVFQTDDEGRTSCYAVARYHDTWRRAADRWRLLTRTVDLRTRLLSPLSPLPI